jgi:hypothetical protein
MEPLARFGNDTKADDPTRLVKERDLDGYQNDRPGEKLHKNDAGRTLGPPEKWNNHCVLVKTLMRTTMPFWLIRVQAR